MKSGEFMHVMATWADAEARSTAQLIEILAAAALMKLNRPTGKEIVELTLGEADLTAVLTDYHYETRYADGQMTILLTPLFESPDSGQEPEVTSD